MVSKWFHVALCNECCKGQTGCCAMPYLLCTIPTSTLTLTHVEGLHFSADLVVSVVLGVLIILAGQVLSLFNADLEVIMHNVLCSHHKNKICKVQ